MVLTDYKIAKTVRDRNAAKQQVKNLRSQFPAVKIISVSIGPVAEPQEMENIGIYKEDIITSNGLEIHTELEKKIAARKLYVLLVIRILQMFPSPWSSEGLPRD